MSPCLRAAFVFVLLLAAAQAQADRYALGQKVRLFDEAFEATREKATRSAALPEILKAVQGYFSGRTDSVARGLTEARRILEMRPVSAAVLWAESRSFQPALRFLDATTTRLEIFVKPIFDAALPETEAELALELVDRTEKRRVRARVVRKVSVKAPVESVVLEIGSAPTGVGEADFDLFASISTDAAAGTLVVWRQTISFAAGLDARLRKLVATAAPYQTISPTETRPILDTAPTSKASSNVRTTLARSLVRAVDLMVLLRDGKPYETDVPAQQILAEAERMAADLAADRSYFSADRPGRYWISLNAGKNGLDANLVLPPKKSAAPRPLVIALHGAGGSDNLFIDGYGAGKIVRLAAERDWVLLTPRAGFFGSPVIDAIDEIARLVPIDKSRVYLIGHSMGSGLAATLADRNPDRFAATALISSGGGKPKNLASRPVFIAAGERDFSLAGSRQLAQALGATAEGDRIFREVPATEHLTVVAAVLDDVFAFFDRH